MFSFLFWAFVFFLSFEVSFLLGVVIFKSDIWPGKAPKSSKSPMPENKNYNMSQKVTFSFDFSNSISYLSFKMIFFLAIKMEEMYFIAFL